MKTDAVVYADERARGGARARTVGVVLGAVALAALAAMPLWAAGQPFLLMLASQALIAALLAVSLDMLVGNTGLLSFGHAGWYGLGAYAAGLGAKHLTAELALLLPLAMLAGALLAAVVGAIFVRQIGKAFAILTLAFSQVLYAVVFIASGVTGGEDGLQAIPTPTLLGLQIGTPERWFLLLAIVVAVLAAALHVRASPLGRAWLGIRENAERSVFIGLDAFRLKLIAYVVSAALAVLAGGLFALMNGATSPETLHWFESGKVLMYVVLGGVGTIVGPALGAGVFTFAEHYVSSHTDAWLVYFGAFFVVVVIVAPGGIFGVLRPLWARLSARGR